MSRHGYLSDEDMPETGVKIFAQQAEQLYQRGVAAARGGQKAVAEKLLRQAVKLNPRHEQAWLWLGGVVDTPDDVGFCLRAVLHINPENERARQGLALIEQSPQIVPPRRTAVSLPPRQALQADGWWGGWRDAQTTWRGTVRALLLIPIVLIASTLGVRAIIDAAPLPTFATVADIPTPRPATPTPKATPTPASTPTSTSHSNVAAYFERINAERRVLQTATEAYRSTTDGGRTSVERATATRLLRDQVQRSRALLAGIQAPPEVAATHQMYGNSLRIEQEALGLMLEFYSNYDVALANRAALGLQEARAQLATATANWDAVARQEVRNVPLGW